MKVHWKKSKHYRLAIFLVVFQTNQIALVEYLFGLINMFRCCVIMMSIFLLTQATSVQSFHVAHVLLIFTLCVFTLVLGAVKL